VSSARVLAAVADVARFARLLVLPVIAASSLKRCG
jgi:hypothetical protein